MESLKGSDRFRQLLKKFNQSKPSANAQSNHDTSVRKSNRDIKKPIKYDFSLTPSTKGPKRKEDVERKNKSVELRDKPTERRGKSSERKDKSRELVRDTDSDAPVVSKSKQQDLREESDSSGSSSPQRSAFTRVSTHDTKRSSVITHQTFQEPSSQSQPSGRRVVGGHCEELPRRQQAHEGSYMPDRRRKRDLDSCYVTERRRLQEYGHEKKLADMYAEGGACDVFPRPQPGSSNQSHWRPDASQNFDLYRTIRQPVVRLDDIARSREHSVLYRSRMDLPPTEVRLVDVMKYQEHAAFELSRATQPPPRQPKQRFDGCFLRPPTPPGTAELARKEESGLLDALSQFKNNTLFSTTEVIFLINSLEDSLIHKMSKTIRKSDAAQSILRKTMVETVPEESSRSHMIQSWLKLNDSVAPPRQANDSEVRSKRKREPTEHDYTKRMRTAADEDGVSYQRCREQHPSLSGSLLKRMEDRRRLDTFAPINHKG